MSWIGLAIAAAALYSSFGGLTWATYRIDTSPQLRGHGREPLISTGWVLVALSFVAGSIYVAWVFDTLLLNGRAVTPADGMFYVPLIVLGAGIIWSIFALVAYRRRRDVRIAARDAREAPSAAMAPAEGGAYHTQSPEMVVDKKGVAKRDMRLARGTRHRK